MEVKYSAAIVEMGVRLRITAQATCTALILYHRFRLKTSYGAAMDQSLISTSCVYLASKCVECPVHLRDVVNVSYRYFQGKDLPLNETYQRLRESVANCELMLLRAFNFNVVVETPHKLLMFFVDGIANSLRDRDRRSYSSDIYHVAQTAMLVLNDFHRHPRCIDFSPEFTATACIYFAMHSSALSTCMWDQWWTGLCACPEADLQAFCETVLEMYAAEEGNAPESTAAASSSTATLSTTNTEDTEQAPSRSVSVGEQVDIDTVAKLPSRGSSPVPPPLADSEKPAATTAVINNA